MPLQEINLNKPSRYVRSTSQKDPVIRRRRNEEDKENDFFYSSVAATTASFIATEAAEAALRKKMQPPSSFWNGAFLSSDLSQSFEFPAFSTKANDFSAPLGAASTVASSYAEVAALSPLTAAAAAARVEDTTKLMVPSFEDFIPFQLEDQPPKHIDECENASNQQPFCFKASVLEPGYVCFQLSHGIVVNVGPNYAIQVINECKEISLALSGCATQMALVHPQGRLLQYNTRIEVQSRGFCVEKNAKIWPRGISFTSSKCAIVYLVDTAGTRSTSDYFHDLYSEDSTQSIFNKSCMLYDEWADAPLSAHDKSLQILDNVNYWQTERAHFWQIDECIITQTNDGFVSVERKYGSELFTLKTSPNNGKARLQSSFIYVTASSGTEAHLFVKSKDRRIHHSNKAFTVRNAGHSAGFDETGSLRIY